MHNAVFAASTGPAAILGVGRLVEALALFDGLGAEVAATPSVIDLGEVVAVLGLDDCREGVARVSLDGETETGAEGSLCGDHRELGVVISDHVGLRKKDQVGEGLHVRVPALARGSALALEVVVADRAVEVADVPRAALELFRHPAAHARGVGGDVEVPAARAVGAVGVARHPHRHLGERGRGRRDQRPRVDRGQAPPAELVMSVERSATIVGGTLEAVPDDLLPGARDDVDVARAHVDRDRRDRAVAAGRVDDSLQVRARLRERPRDARAGLDVRGHARRLVDEVLEMEGARALLEHGRATLLEDFLGGRAVRGHQRVADAVLRVDGAFLLALRVDGRAPGLPERRRVARLARRVFYFFEDKRLDDLPAVGRARRERISSPELGLGGGRAQE
mmetsp:Transcript_3192/g.9572  ORF Transcript_3192/g.9572 Transcript_3192/m.9572 type:complete len:393 (+) Transcript_3192:298-1476(+)